MRRTMMAERRCTRRPRTMPWMRLSGWQSAAPTSMRRTMLAERRCTMQHPENAVDALEWLAERGADIHAKNNVWPNARLHRAARRNAVDAP